MSTKIVILLIILITIFLFSRFSGFIFRWIFKVAGEKIYKKAMEQQQRQAEILRRRQEGFKGDAVNKDGMTILIPDEAPVQTKPNYDSNDDGDGEYVDFEELK
ncbi:DUF4834 family protein [Limibacter armeniacum]|uniref:DUF4834 family protein n=1 Tax=Limibacter armeniacum TaxID=466084 RepID=UPI002FE5C5D8